jgi:hypothetical protein
MACASQSFPSPQLPVFDGTVVSLNLPPGQTTWRLRFQHVAGIATDGVASMELRTASGKRIARVAVVGNVYVFAKSKRSFTTPGGAAAFAGE